MWSLYSIPCRRLAALLLLVNALASSVCGEDAHLAINPVYRLLREDGISANDASYRFPAPQFDSALDGDQQRAFLGELLDADLHERFFRRSAVAPHVIKLGQDPTSPGYTRRDAHFWFALHTSLDDAIESDVLRRVTANAGDEDEALTDTHVFTAEELLQRGIDVRETKGTLENQIFAFGQHRLLNKVDVAATTWSCWSRHDPSVTVAFCVDSRFLSDSDFANQWWKLQRTESGELHRGTAQAFEGAGGYVHLTQLTEPADCLLVEGHVAYFEPHGWFRGANLLASKLPSIVQAEIRRIRQVLMASAAE